MADKDEDDKKKNPFAKKDDDKGSDKGSDKEKKPNPFAKKGDKKDDDDKSDKKGKNPFAKKDGDKKSDKEDGDEKGEKDIEDGEKNPKKSIDTDPELKEEALETLDEAGKPLDIQARRKRAQTMRRFKNKIAIGRKRAMKRKATPEKLLLRAKKKARDIMRRKLSAGKDYNTMAPAEKLAVDKRLARVPDAVIERIAKRLIPQVRQGERERMQAANKPAAETEVKKEEFDAASVEQTPAEKKKRFHKLLTKEGGVHIDKRFKIYKGKERNLAEGIEELADLVEGSVDITDPDNREQGTDSLVRIFKQMTPGQDINEAFNLFFGGDE